jgi:hypothetical protein
MKSCQKYFYSLLGITAFLSAAPFHAAWAQTAPSLGAAESFSVLGGSAVTCTTSVITGDVGVSPGSVVTNTGCTIAGTVHVNDQAAIDARAAFLATFNALAPQAGDCDVAHTLLSTIPVSRTLLPGTYCTGAALTATGVTLTLDGNGETNPVWIFKIGAGLTGTNFSVVMANGGQACNVFWRVGAAVEMTDTALQGNVLAGAAITMTRGSLIGRALANANVPVTLTDTNIHGTCAVIANARKDKCDADDDDDDHDRDHHKHKRHHHKDHDNDRDHDKNDKDHRKY